MECGLKNTALRFCLPSYKMCFVAGYGLDKVEVHFGNVVNSESTH